MQNTNVKSAKSGNKTRTKRTNSTPARLHTSLHQGIYISPSRVKYWLDSNGINRDLDKAIKELREAEPHQKEIIDPKTKKKTGKYITTQLTMFDQLSEETRKTIQRIQSETARAEQKARDNAEKRERKLEEDIKKGLVDPDQLEKERIAREERQKRRQEDREVKREEEKVRKAAENTDQQGARKGRVPPNRLQKKRLRYGSEIALLSKNRIRFAKEASTVIAATICSSLHELFAFGMQNAVTQKRKKLLTRHLLQPGFEKLQLCCFYDHLTAFKRAQIDDLHRQEVEARLRDEKKAKKRAEALAERESKDAKRIEEQLISEEVFVLQPLDQSVPVPVQETPVPEVKQEVKPAEPVTDSEDEDDDGRSFVLYVKQLCFNIMNIKVESRNKQNKLFNNIRLSKEVLEFGNQLIIGFTERLVPLLRGQIRTMDVKTVSRDVVDQTLNFMLEYVGYQPDNFHVLINKKIAEYTTAQENKRIEKQNRELQEEKNKQESTDTSPTTVIDNPEKSTDDEDETSDIDSEDDETAEDSEPVKKSVNKTVPEKAITIKV